MSNEVHIDELLSAYLAGDVTPSERAAVEHRLVNNPALRNQLAELQSLAAILKQAQRPVTPAMLAELKRRVEGSMPKPVELLAASITGDLNSVERATVDQLLSEQPAARRELASLRAMSSFLKKAELSASANAGRKLIDRLSAKLPAKALSPMLPGAHETVAIKLHTSAPTVRIYAAQESPWRKRILRAAVAVAAAIVFSAGTIFGLKALNDGVSNTAKVPPQPRVPPVNPPEAPLITPDETPITPVAPNSQSVVPTPPAPSLSSDVPPAPPTPNGAVNPNTVTPTEPRSTAPATVPTPFVPKVQHKPYPPAPVEPKHGPDLTPAPSPAPIVEPDQQTVVENSKPKSNGGPPIVPTIPNGTGPLVVPTNGDVATVNPKVAATSINPGTQSVNPTAVPSTETPDPAPTPTPPVDNSIVAAVDGKMVVGVIREPNDVTISPSLPPDQPFQLKAELPTDTTITTGGTRLGLVLPGDGRLWINKSTKVTVQLKGVNTILTLDFGEISYRAPQGGNVTVNYSTTLQASSGDLVDVNINALTSTMQVLVVDGTARVVRKGKSTINLSTKTKNSVVANLDLSDNPAAIAVNDHVLLWQEDLNVNKEGSDGKSLTTTSKSKDTTKSRGR